MTNEKRRNAIATGLALALALLLPAGVRAAGEAAQRTLQSRAVAFVETMAHGHFKAAESDFTEQMRQAAPPPKLGAAWRGLLSHLGAFQSTGKTQVVDVAGFTGIVVRANFKLRALGIRVVFDSTGRIAGMQFVPPP
jgi:hypothetical protein